jgi:AraC family transcriptional regulator of adaptative response/methylated-DNA-[protein]-cysteine methyltransferase
MSKMTKEFEKELIEKIALKIAQHTGGSFALEQLANEAQLSPWYFQKRFKAILGVSPKEFQQACRIKKFKSLLRQGATITDSLYKVGFGSPSRVYEKIGSRLGMTPLSYKQNGQGLQISYGVTKTGIGLILIAATDRGICSIIFGKTKKDLVSVLKNEFPKAQISEISKQNNSALRKWIFEIKHVLAGRNEGSHLPLDIYGTAFQVKVWQALQQIPVGQTKSYTDVAKAIGKPKAFRAVANACGKNPVPILVPCHRVIRGNGDLGGYSGGLDKKIQLLKIEQIK